MYETGELFVTNCDETCTDDGRLESAAAGLWAWPTNCNSLKLSLWDSDARAQRESSACLRMSERLFARKKKDKPLMFGPQRCTLGLMCPHCNSNLADKSLYGCHEQS